MRKYEMVIGLEVHVELATKTKIFCSCKSQFGSKVNTNVCPVCMGMPGTLPVLNKKVVEYAIALGLATNCTINRMNKFDRKNYFYPDNPQNYQISQLYEPICKDGFITIGNRNSEDFNDENSIEYNENNCVHNDKNNSDCNGTGIFKEENVHNKTKHTIDNDNIRTIKRIGIHEMHMEEDAGKIIHDEERGLSLIDYNRAGVPLIEIVTKPHMSCAEEVLEFLDKLRLIIKYLKISDCKLNEGSMRVDVNLSVKEVGSEELGVRTEMKNLNSFKAISRAIDHEYARQIQLLEEGKMVIQETRRWDDNKNCSYSMRSKEDVNDYRYFPEPDVPGIYIDKQWIEEIARKQPEFRDEKRARYKKEYALPDYDIDVLTEEKNIADLFEAILNKINELPGTNIAPKKVSNWIMVDMFKIINDRGLAAEHISVNPEDVSTLITLVEDKKLTKANGIEVLEVIFDNKLLDMDVETYIKEKGLMMVDNDDELLAVIEEVFANNLKSIEDYHNGKTKAMGYLVGQTMKAMKGKASPDKVNLFIRQKLEGYSC